MTEFNSPLNNLKVASPCTADWQAMTGDERKRFCGQCNLNVYNLSGMTKDAAEQLIRQSEGKVCVRFYRRADGTVITDDCPVGWQAYKKKMARTAGVVASAALSFIAGLGLAGLMPKNSGLLSQQGQATMGDVAISHEVPPPPQPVHTMGRVAAHPAEAEMGKVAPSCAVRSVPLPVLPPVAIVRRSEGVLRGNAINRAVPDYPALARSARVAGDVVCEITINEAGEVESARVISGHPLLQQATIAAARNWTFKPITLDGHGVKIQGVLTFRYQL